MDEILKAQLPYTLRQADFPALGELYRGKVRMQGSREDFKNTPDPVVQQFITGRATGPFEL